MNGVAVSHARGVGTIAPGAGPIFIGNDADGRSFHGTVDTVWFNTLAAPASTILGLTCIRHLSGVPANRIAGYNIVYATHPYNNAPEKQPQSWDQFWGFLTATDPVVATEFGDFTCATAYDTELIQYADKHSAGWTAWAWFPGGCSYPSLVSDWMGTPTAQGAIVKSALLGYSDPPASPALPGEPSTDAELT